MVKKKEEDKSVKDKLVEAALNLASAKSWGDVSFEEIVIEAGILLEDGHEYFDDKSDVMAAYGRKIDREMMKNVSYNEGMSHREKIFDIVMERFDLLNENRASLISILNSFKGDPKQAILGLPHLARSMTRVLEATNISTDGVAGCVRVMGLTGLYIYVLKTWVEDDSSDMNKTMARLDKGLDKAEILYNSLPIA